MFLFFSEILRDRLPLQLETPARADDMSQPVLVFTNLSFSSRTSKCGDGEGAVEAPNKNRNCASTQGTSCDPHLAASIIDGVELLRRTAHGHRRTEMSGAPQTARAQSPDA